MVGLLGLLLTGLFGLGAGLGGVALQARLQSNEKNRDRAEEKKRLLREKAEQIHAEIEEVNSRSERAVYGSIDAVAGGRYDVTLGLTPNLNRLRALCLMYFPITHVIFDEHDRLIYEPIKSHEERYKKAMSGSGSAAEKSKLVKESASTCTQEAHKILIKTLHKLRTAMHQEVAALL